MFTRDRVSDDKFFLVIICLAAAAIRLHLLYATHFVVDADEAIVGLMAKHIMEGKGVPVFYYGQQYMGSFEALCAALSFRIFGVSSAALKLVPLTFSLLLVPAVYALCLEISSRATARLAALFIALPPIGLVEWSGKARGGFIEILLIGALALYLAIKFFKSDWRSKNARAYLMLSSFLLGLGWWINNQIIYFIVPVAILGLIWAFLEGALASVIQALTRAGGAFFIGGAPYWLYNMSHDFGSFRMFHSAGQKDFNEHLHGLFTTALPILMGAKRFWHTAELFPGSLILAYGTYGLFLLVFFIALLRKWGQSDPIWFWAVFPITFAGACLIFISSSFGYLVQAPRYLLPLYVVLMPFSAYVITEILFRNRFSQIFFTAAVLFLNLSSDYWGGLAIPGEPFVYDGERVSRDHSQLISWLAEHQIRFVRTNYWIGYRLAFETEERVRFAMFQEPYQIRIPEYQTASVEAGNILDLPIVAVPSQGAVISKALDLLQIPYKKEMLSGYAVFYDIHQSLDTALLHPVPNDEVVISTNTHPETIGNALDGDLSTRWGSGRPQSPGMEVDVEFKAPLDIRRVVFQLGAFSTDFPRRLEVDYEDQDAQRSILLTDSDLEAIFYYLSVRNASEVILPPGAHRKLCFIEKGTDPVFDWSIAELKLFSIDEAHSQH